MYDSTLLNGPVEVFKAQGQKCHRCWKYDVNVGQDKAYPDVCPRCSEVLRLGVSA